MKKQIQQTGLMAIIFAAFLASSPAISAAAEPDDYESDNSYDTANIIILNSDTPQPHNFHEAGDQDWVKFFGLAGKAYHITASNTGNADIIIRLCGTDGRTVLKKKDGGLEGEDESLSSDPLPQDGIFYVMLSDVSAASDEDKGYELTALLSEAPQAVPFDGSVRDAFSDNPLGDTMIRSTQNFTALSENGDGAFVMYHEPLAEADTFSLKEDAVTLTARVPGYDIFRRLAFMLEGAIRVLPDDGDTPGTARAGLRVTREDTVQASDLIEWDGVIELLPAIIGDINSDRTTNLADAIIALKVLAGRDAGTDVRPYYATSGADANGNGQIGLEEMIHILGHAGR